MRKWCRRILSIIAFLFFLTGSLAAYYLSPAEHIPADKPVTKILVEKGKRLLHVYSNEEKLVTYPISLGRNPQGDKKCQGDNKTPEGLYVLDWRNPQSCCYKSFHISYPDASDRAEAAQLGCSPGGDIMIHGISNGMGWIGRFHRLVDWTSGCISVTDEEMEQLWQRVPVGTPIEITP